MQNKRAAHFLLRLAMATAVGFYGWHVLAMAGLPWVQTMVAGMCLLGAGAILEWNRDAR